MFWRLPFRPTSSLDTTISKDDVTLYQILDDEDIIQEGKTQNPKLCDFISIPENLLELVSLITTLPSEQMGEKIRYKYPNIACELLCSNMGSISDSLVNEHFISLTSFLKLKPPLNPLFSSFCCKVLTFLCKNKSNEIFSNFRLHYDILQDLMLHIGTSSCMDLILQLVTIGEHQQLEFIHWLDDKKLIQSLVGMIRAGSSPDVCYNASQLLIEIQRVERDSCIETLDTLIFIQVMESQEVIENILRNVFMDEDGPSRSIHLQCCIAFLQGLLQPVRSLDQMIYPDLSLPIRLGTSNIEANSPIEGFHSVKEFPLSQGGIKVLNIISRHVFDFHTLLSESPEIFFHGAPVLGYRRLVIIRLLTAILQVTPSQFQLRFISSGILKTLLDLFIKFPWNNFLHTQVEIIVRTLLSPFTKSNEDKVAKEIDTTELILTGDDVDSMSSTELFKLILSEGEIIEKLLQCWEANQISQISKGRRMGYMGHLTIITNRVTEILQSDKDLLCIFDEFLPDEVLKSWNRLVSEDLTELNLKNESKMGGDSLVPNFTPPEEDIPSDPVINQAYTEYQLFPVAANFEDGFGGEDELFYEEIASNPFSELNSFDFSLTSDEDKSSIHAFLDMCNGTINLFNEHSPIHRIIDSPPSSESDDWTSHPIESNYNRSNNLRISEFDSDEDDDDEDHDSDIPEKIKSSLNDSSDMIETHIFYTQTVNGTHSQTDSVDEPFAMLQKETFSHCGDVNETSLNWPLGESSNPNTWAEFGPFSNISSESKTQEVSSLLTLKTPENLITTNDDKSQDIFKGSKNDEISSQIFHHCQAIDMESEDVSKIGNREIDYIHNRSDEHVLPTKVGDLQDIYPLQDVSIKEENIAVNLFAESPQVHSVTQEIVDSEDKKDNITSDFFNLNLNNNNNIEVLNVTDTTDCLGDENFTFLNSLGLIHDYFSIPNLESPSENMPKDINSGALAPSCQFIDEDHANLETSNDESLLSFRGDSSFLSVAGSRDLAVKAHNEYLVNSGQSKIAKSL
ncbi:Serine/threonine-protein phosphatase 6 regulatory subunit 3-like isoform X2 [Oopsacas minuta]|uniref:Serine/threonine-protein phosphatase 6 regulatory subunit 3-like isoform X2 n=1 Tax=Oopsacas minuta TaxID=111878 RepID=A0AAV7K6V2_9METZ|nr:Serine/threonine-protein phosphatase 6 regulatory subunit 3-like isoform X2 [Oopsacas minuta]